MTKFARLLMAAVGAAVLVAQDTDAGRQLKAWIDAVNSGNRGRIEQFVAASMSNFRPGFLLSVYDQSGGLELLKVESSGASEVVALVRSRGPEKQSWRVTLNVGPDAKITGVRLEPASGPSQGALRKLTEAEAAAAREFASHRQFLAWLNIFNAADRTRLADFAAKSFPSLNVDAQMNFRSMTGGFDIHALERATPTTLSGVMKERDSDQFARFTIEVEPARPHRILRLPVNATPRPADVPVPVMTEAGLIAALGAKLERDAAAGRFAGAVMLSKGGRVLFQGAYGLADRAKQTPNTIDTCFRIGSMNKMFTATAVLQLAQAGRLLLTDPIGTHIKDYPNQDIARKVTIHHLLTHTGGTGDIFGPQFEARRLELKTHDDYVRLYGDRAPAFEPGSRFSYSNYGMILAGVAIERVTGKSYYEYVFENIFKPAGMTRSGSQPEHEAVPGRSVGYMRDGVPNTDTLPYRGTSAGGGYSTVGDLVKFAQALLEHKLLDARHTRLLTAGKVAAGPGRRYAYGFEDAGDWVGHGGGAPGMNGDLKVYLKSGYVLAVLSNLDPPAAQRVSAYVDLRLPR